MELMKSLYLCLIYGTKLLFGENMQHPDTTLNTMCYIHAMLRRCMHFLSSRSKIFQRTDLVVFVKRA